MTIMTKKYDKLDETFDVKPTEVVKEKVDGKIEQIKSSTEDIRKD